ncbi:hypothetical protein CROQUDRAFT_129655 [Cronartium quercuum f. sp. fusiforme G11]|uniref:Uncharacterized protein n=1 Tax=Cronartium quercuum f. sp. fusiforme G11 TaxID=708437 RepID=A0A9P6TIX8_9BASI|nr:hypothetical protein CROQUDRAFT_129655 [Cronartium quercuum f. sp. fusiforme G11]
MSQTLNPPSSHSSQHLHPGLHSESHPDSRLYQHQHQHQHQQAHVQSHQAQHQHQHTFNQQSESEQRPNDDQKPQLSQSGNPIYESNYLHLPPPNANIQPHSQSNHNCFASANDRSAHPVPTRTISPSLSHRSTPTPSPTSSPSSPPFYTNPTTILDLNSIVSYSQLIARREEVVAALKYRSGDHYGAQALELLKSGRERVKRITAAGRAATGKPPVKHIQEQYLAVFSRFSEYCASQNIPTWPIEPVRVAIWVLAMQEKAPPTPATLRQYITRLEFTCTVTAGLFENEFGPSSPLKASALLRELVNRDLPGQPNPRPARSPALGKASSKRARSASANEGSLTPPSAKKWQGQPEPGPGPARSEYGLEHYDAYLSPFGTPASYHPSPLGAGSQSGEIWPPARAVHHQYPSEPVPQGSYHPHHPQIHPHHHRELIARHHEHAHHLEFATRSTTDPHPRSAYHHGPSSAYVSGPSSATFSATSSGPPSAPPTSAPQSITHDPRFTSGENNPWV